MTSPSQKLVRSCVLACVGLNGIAACGSPAVSSVAGQRLEGGWKLAIDPKNVGRTEQWFERARDEAADAPVPGIIQQVYPAYNGVAWYWKSFRPNRAVAAEERVLLHFGAVDYVADVWVNGTHVGSYEGGETPFEFDVTSLLRAEGENLLAVRVINPTVEGIDGFVLHQTPGRNKSVDPAAGGTFNSGGIMYPVHLRFVPAVHLADLFVRPDPKTGRLAISLTVRNSVPEAVQGEVAIDVSPAAGGDRIDRVRRDVELRPGVSVHELSMEVPQPRLWNLDDPFLYRVGATVVARGGGIHELSVRTGFRDFRVEGGWFHLNGKRIFAKSTHTGNVMPIGQLVAPAPDLVRRDLLHAKASGFNMVRFISGVAYPEQLDFCDEIGLMVYEECFAAWLLQDSPEMKARFDRSTAAMVRRDRNHPSVTVWGLLNETHNGPVFRNAVDFLPTLRELDPTRLVVLSSGRWDRQHSIGSVSNPGGTTWEHAWGAERPDAPNVPGDGPYAWDDLGMEMMGYFRQAGDAHVYPPVPHPPAVDRFIRGLGEDTKPVFLSEYGTGSLFNVIRERRHYEQHRARPDLKDFALVVHQSDALEADWKRLGFTGVYPFAEDMLRESQRLHARLRTLGFNLVRSNPHLSGYNLTGMLDHAMTGEGLWNFWREWKPETFDAVTGGWAPLRWCLFAAPMHAYVGRPFTVEAVLANEGVLAPGDYPVRFRIFGPQGIAWEKATVVRIPEDAAFAVPVLREEVTIAGPAGEYTLAASLDRGGAPTDDRLAFTVSEPVASGRLTGKVVTWGIDAKARAWLEACGLTVTEVGDSFPADCTVVLVGVPTDAVGSPLWESLERHVADGGTAIFLSSRLFRENSDAVAWLPLQNKGRCSTFQDWLYHKECVARRHPVMAGLHGAGIMPLEYYGPVWPRDVFEGMETPDDTIAASFVTGHHSVRNGYASGILIAAWRSGSGRLVLSTPRLLENLDLHPAADRLLANLIAYSQGAATPP